jgi:hypothetical protein
MGGPFSQELISLSCPGGRGALDKGTLCRDVLSSLSAVHNRAISIQPASLIFRVTGSFSLKHGQIAMGPILSSRILLKPYLPVSLSRSSGLNLMGRWRAHGTLLLFELYDNKPSTVPRHTGNLFHHPLGLAVGYKAMEDVGHKRKIYTLVEEGYLIAGVGDDGIDIGDLILSDNLL